MRSFILIKPLKLTVFHFLWGIGILLAFSSCTCHRLTIQTQYLNSEYLASHHVRTPDPRLFHPIIGQRLVLQWSLCDQQIEEHETYLYLKVRFRNHCEKEIRVPITSPKGVYLYKIVNEDYDQSGGVLTYFAEIRDNTRVLASWRHPLWAQLIQLHVSNMNDLRFEFFSPFQQS